MATFDEIKARHAVHGKNSIAPLQLRYAWAHSDRGDLIRMVEELQAQVDRVKALPRYVRTADGKYLRDKSGGCVKYHELQAALNGEST